MTLHWDRIDQTAMGKTIWADANKLDEAAVAREFKDDGTFAEIEEQFKAKRAVVKAAKKVEETKKTELGFKDRQRMEILLKTAGPDEEDLATRAKTAPDRLLRCDPRLLTEKFLTALKAALPDPAVTGKLAVYRNASDETLEELEIADRFLVHLLRLHQSENRGGLESRVKNLLYRSQFEEAITLLDERATKILDALEALQNARHFRELLQLILLFGNYLNATGAKGGAFGFRLTSINKLVDTKSSANSSTTLLHFLERKVSTNFPDMEAFIPELAKPAEAYKRAWNSTLRH